MRDLWRLVLYVLKAIVCGVAFMVGQMFGGAVLGVLRLPIPTMPAGADVKTMGERGLMASPLLGLLAGPLAAGLGVGFVARWLALSFFGWVAYGLNNAIEAQIFTSVGPWYTTAVMGVLPCLLLGLALAGLFRPAVPAEGFGARARRFFAARGAGQWAWRLAAAVLAFPVIYFIFGMMVTPFVMSYYREHAAGLRVPSLGVLLPVLLLRSSLFVLCTLPVLIAWAGGRGRLILALGLALWVVVGLYAMCVASWMPQAIRLPHALEIGADSFAHAAALVLLLVPKSAGAAPAGEPLPAA
jgi:hypothetical protein